jgi:hypothetical protein
MAILLSQDFNDDTGASDGSSATLPSGWEKADGGNMVVYTAQNDSDLGGYQNNRGWVFGYLRTPSNLTGPGGGMSTETTGSNGAWTSSSDKRYMYVETSVWYPNKYNLIRTQAIDLSSVTAPVTMTFWFHMYGATMGNLGIAATTATHDASSAFEAGTGLGFTGDDAGGATITYWTNDDGSTTATGVRISGQQQTEGNYNSLGPANYWRKATVDLSAAVGESTVYIYFFCKSGSGYKGDLAIDAFQIEDDSSAAYSAALYGAVAQVAVTPPLYSAALYGAVAQVAVTPPLYSAALYGAVAQVAVIPPPPVAVVPDISGAPTVLATFDGSGSQYAHYYAWEWTSLPGGSAIGNPTGVTTATFAFTPDVTGTYTVQLEAADGVSTTADAVISASSGSFQRMIGLRGRKLTGNKFGASTLMGSLSEEED